MTETELAWFAGLFEGEGYFCLIPKNYKVSMRIKMTDEDVIRKLGILFGGKVNGPYYDKRPNRKPSWYWDLSGGENLRSVIIHLLPYLGSRRYSKALEILQYIDCRGTTKNAPT